MSLSLPDPITRTPPSPARPAAWARPASLWRLAWQAARQRRVVHRLFVAGPGEVWSYEPEQPHAATRHEALAEWCAQHPRSQACLVVSGHATHDLVVQDGTLPLHGPADVAAWAAHQFAHYHGSAAQGWAVAPWQAAGRSGATAIHGLDLDALAQTAQAHGVQLRAVLAWWPVALAAATRRLPALQEAGPLELLVVEGTLLTRVSCSAGAVLDVQQRWLEQPTLPALQVLLQELAPSPAQAAHTVLLGYGIGDADAAALQRLPVRVLGSLHEACPAHAWLAA